MLLTQLQTCGCIQLPGRTGLRANRQGGELTRPAGISPTARGRQLQRGALSRDVQRQTVVCGTAAQLKRGLFHGALSQPELADREIGLQRGIAALPFPRQAQLAHPIGFPAHVPRRPVQAQAWIVLGTLGTHRGLDPATGTRPQVRQIGRPQIGVQSHCRAPLALRLQPGLTGTGIQPLQRPLRSRALQRAPCLHRPPAQLALKGAQINGGSQLLGRTAAVRGQIKPQTARPARIQRARIQALPLQRQIPGHLRRPADVALAAQAPFEQIARLDVFQRQSLAIPLADQRDAGGLVAGPGAGQLRLHVQPEALQRAVQPKFASRAVEGRAGPAQILPGQPRGEGLIGLCLQRPNPLALYPSQR